MSNVPVLPPTNLSTKIEIIANPNTSSSSNTQNDQNQSPELTNSNQSNSKSRKSIVPNARGAYSSKRVFKV